MVWLAVFLAAGLVCAQTSVQRPSQPPPAKHTTPAVTAWPLEALKVEGNRIYSAQRIVRVAGLRVGQIVDRDAFEAAKKRLEDTGAFALVGYRFGPDADGKGYIGVITVAEVEQLYPYRFEDLPAPEGQLRAAIEKAEPLFGAKLPGTREVMARCAQAVQGYLAPKGFKDKVSAKLVADDPGKLVVVFRPDRPDPVVAEVQFNGNTVLSETVLQNGIAPVAIGVPFTERRFRQFLDGAIRPLYEARGRIGVSFPKISAEKSHNVNGLLVTVTIAEGPGFSLGDVRIAPTVLPSAELLKIAHLTTGDVANFDAVRESQQRMEARFKREGYVKVTSTVERVVHEAEKKVDVIFHFDTGPQYHFGKLNIEGLDILTEPAIRKMWAPKYGQPFDSAYPQYFLDQIKEQGLFENLHKTSFENHVDENSHTVDVTLVFR